MTAAGGRLYVLGGNLPKAGSGEAKSSRLYRYNPRRDRWTRLADSRIERGAHGRFAARAGRLYAAGGYTESNDSVRAVEIYEIDRGRWRRGPRMPTGRNHVGAAFLGGELFVTGGRPGEVDGGQATVESYDPAKRRWTERAPLATARSGHAAAVAAGTLVVFGGEELAEGGTTIEQVEAYDAAADRWSALPQMITPRHGLGAAAAGSRLFALEGGPQPGLAYSRSLEFLDLPR